MCPRRDRCRQVSLSALPAAGTVRSGILSTEFPFRQRLTGMRADAMAVRAHAIIFVNGTG